jgi:hypothetical protein
VDRSALDYAFSLEGEHASRADKFRREANQLEQQAKELRQQAEREDERAQWARMAAAALQAEAR